MFVLQVLKGVIGARALFGHILAPDVRQVEVLYWRDENHQQTVSHTALCTACPHAEMLYPLSSVDCGARRVDK